jgi:hypothetical protein
VDQRPESHTYIAPTDEIEFQRVYDGSFGIEFEDLAVPKGAAVVVA